VAVLAGKANTELRVAGKQAWRSSQRIESVQCAQTPTLGWIIRSHNSLILLTIYHSPQANSHRSMFANCMIYKEKNSFAVMDSDDVRSGCSISLLGVM
jgi:hypothetical protein